MDRLVDGLIDFGGHNGLVLGDLLRPTGEPGPRQRPEPQAAPASPQAESRRPNRRRTFVGAASGAAAAGGTATGIAGGSATTAAAAASQQSGSFRRVVAEHEEAGHHQDLVRRCNITKNSVKQGTTGGTSSARPGRVEVTTAREVSKFRQSEKSVRIW